MDTRLKSQFEKLDITVVTNDEGEFGAFSAHEPVFFVTADTEEAVVARARSILADYVETFYGEAGASVTLGVAPEPIRVKSVRRLDAQLAFA